MENNKIPVSPVEVAHFRFGLIAPVIQGTFSDASEAAYFRRVTESPIRRPDGTDYKYSPDTLERWVSLYRKHGMDGLTPNTRKDKGISRSLDAETIDEIYRLIAKFPRMSGVMIHEKLINGGFITHAVSVRAIQRFIKENGLRSANSPGVQKDRMAFEMENFGELWQADTAYFPYIPKDGGKKHRTYCIMLIDDHSRMLVGGGLFFNDNAGNFQKVLKDAIRTYGIPEKLYMDNGSPYKNRQLSRILKELGIIEIHTPVRDGASKGKIERNFRTMRSRFLAPLDIGEIASLDDFNSRLNRYMVDHNTRKHSGTGTTPMDRFAQTNGRIRLPKSKEWLDECFLNRETRKVRPDSCITIANVEYDCPPQLIGEKVEVRFLPDRMDDAYILDEDRRRYPLHRTNRVENSRTKRGGRLSIDYSGEAGI